MDWREGFAQILDREFTTRKGRNRRLSWRSFAKSIRLSPSALTLLRKGRMKLSPARAAGILDHLELDMIEKNRLLISMQRSIGAVERSTLRPQDEPILTDWRYLGVLFAYDCNPRMSLNILARKFGTDEDRIADVREDLCARGLLRALADGSFELSEKHWSSDAGACSNVNLRRHHENSLVLSTQALALSADQRDFSSMTFAGSVAQLEDARQEIRLFHDRMLAIMTKSNGAQDEVFKLSIQLFPIDFREAK